MSGIIFDHGSDNYVVSHFNSQKMTFASKLSALQYYRRITGHGYIGNYSAPFVGELFVTTSKSYNIYNKKRSKKSFFKKLKSKKKKQRGKASIDDSEFQELPLFEEDDDEEEDQPPIIIDEIVDMEEEEEEQDVEDLEEEEGTVEDVENVSFEPLFSSSSSSSSSDEEDNPRNLEIILSKQKLKNEF
jgi:hypothetical protein